ncbi:hypothetical protein H0H81_002937 [Sphagnurus paluster]|uniref:Amidohydrolase-related domain-containing protein n=1 Tax=Sphagnurus paluster TaxID=117069 RepID=A0A9P7K7Y9_9AGAR|nr:hypothetical protein H0H81_002937 [Sphagnurus paluster]
MDKLPSHLPSEPPRRKRAHLRSPLLAAAATLFSLGVLNLNFQSQGVKFVQVPINAAEIQHKCKLLDAKPGPPDDFHLRTVSDRFQPGTPPTLIRNATIWTGRVSGHEVVVGDLLLDRGIIQSLGDIPQSVLDAYNNLVVVDAEGAWVSPGIVDMHSHLGVDSAPALKGSDDTNSLKGLVLPWLRSLDGLNTHDEAYRLSVSGGVTTSVILPGSADAIGGQAFVIKLRPTVERSSSSMLLEPPYSLNNSDTEHLSRPRWRQMKHACGENPSRVYSGTRMDTIWAFRQGYDTARKIKESQDEYCQKALANQWDNLGDYPEDLQWEALVDVLRGRVKLSNEFKFSIAAFHHAHETYLVPDLVKKAHGTTPAVALFATNGRYKREAYRGSEFAPRILSDNGLRVVMKSDHPVLNSRHLVYEAQQAHYYGLAENLALAAVTSTPATVIGQDHRIGFIKTGYDADVIVWDSHPLALGATPKQVFIDGIAQIAQPFSVKKAAPLQRAPETPNFDKEMEDTLKYDGLPPLQPIKDYSGIVTFTNVSSIHLRHGRSIREVFSASVEKRAGKVIIERGHVKCAGHCSEDAVAHGSRRINLHGGSISPGLLTYGSSLGVTEIQMESSTNDGDVFDPLTGKVPSIVGGDGSIIQAVDGLQFDGRNSLSAYRFGVTTGIVAPTSSGFLSGLSTAFSTGVAHRMVEGAVLQNVTALHVTVGHSKASVSTQIATLRRLILGGGDGDLAVRFHQVAEGELPLVIEVHSADIMASLIHLKQEAEHRSGNIIKMTFSGASEAHLLAKEIGENGVGVILSPSRPFPSTWQSRRILPGAPLTEQNAVAVLTANNVTVGLGVEEAWAARNLRFDVGWSALQTNGQLSKSEALALASTNLEILLGLNTENSDLVATQGGDLISFEGKVISVVSPGRGVVDLF